MNASTVSAEESTREPSGHRAILRACDMCRRKKIRCVTTEQGCAHCTKLAIPCHFTPIKVKKKPRRPAGYRYISELEEKLKKMESLRHGSSSRPPDVEVGVSEDPAPPRGLPIDFVGDVHLGSAPAAERNPWMEFGHAAPGTRFRDDSTSLGESVAPWNNTVPAHYPDDAPEIVQYSGKNVVPDLGPFSMPALQELPPKSIALEMVTETFQNFNQVFPLFDEEEFMDEFNVKYTRSSPDDPAWWACINVVLTLSHRYRARRSLDPTYDNMRSCGYIHNALIVVSELTVSSGTISAVQALVGIAIILQGTPNPGPSLVLISAAIRLAQIMNMHRYCRETGKVTERQREQRKRVFWIAYIFDKDISLRMKHPPAQDDDEMDVPLPTRAESQHSGSGNDCPGLSILNSRISLAVIQGQIYKKLYSVHASRQSEAHRAAAAQELSSLLSFWWSAIDSELLDLPTTLWRGHVSDELMQRFVLRLTYVYCLTLVDPHLQPMVNPTPWDSCEVASNSQGSSIWESRKALRLLQFTRPGSYDCVWILLHPLFAAASSLLVHVSRNPLSPDAPGDIQLVQPFIRLLEALAADQRRCARSEESQRLERMCKELEGEAKAAFNLLREFEA